MTNAQIIDNAKRANGITEEAHTFAHWKHLGYCVRKGERAAFSAVIWKCASKRRKGGKANAEAEPEEASMFLKRAYFFTASQVDSLAIA